MMDAAIYLSMTRNPGYPQPPMSQCRKLLELLDAQWFAGRIMFGRQGYQKMRPLTNLGDTERDKEARGATMLAPPSKLEPMWGDASNSQSALLNRSVTGLLEPRSTCTRA